MPKCWDPFVDSADTHRARATELVNDFNKAIPELMRILNTNNSVLSDLWDALRTIGGSVPDYSLHFRRAANFHL